MVATEDTIQHSVMGWDNSKIFSLRKISIRQGSQRSVTEMISREGCPGHRENKQQVRSLQQGRKIIPRRSPQPLASPGIKPREIFGDFCPSLLFLRGPNAPPPYVSFSCAPLCSTMLYPHVHPSGNLLFCSFHAYSICDAKKLKQSFGPAASGRVFLKDSYPFSEVLAQRRADHWPELKSGSRVMKTFVEQRVRG